jgi:5-methylcytosine-specific restriction protein A
MPARPAKPCTHPGCGVLVRDGTRRCEKHALKPWARTAPPPERIRGRKLQALRAALFMREPLCRPCSALGVVSLATIRDHVVALEEGGLDEEDNVQPICKACHDSKSQQEAQRGRGRPVRPG